jgi:Na+/proline symporter
MGLLNWIDLCVVAFYLVGITYLGSRFYQRQAGMQEYLRGSRSMKWFPVALSILAAKTSAISYLGVPAWSFQENTKLSMQYFTYLLAIPLVVWIFVPVYSKGNLFTAYEFLEQRFDIRIRLIGSLIFMAIRGATVAVILYAPALMMSELMGVPLTFSVLVMGVLTTFYTTMGGIKAVIWTDAIQLVVYLVGAVVAAMVLLANVPLFANIPAQVYGFAATVAMALVPATPGSVTEASMANPVVTIILSMIVGAIFGYVSEKVAGMLMGAGDHRAAAKA